MNAVSNTKQKVSPKLLCKEIPRPWFSTFVVVGLVVLWGGSEVPPPGSHRRATPPRKQRTYYS